MKHENEKKKEEKNFLIFKYIICQMISEEARLVENYII